MKLSIAQAIVVASAIVVIGTLAALGRVDGAIAVTVLSALAGNALGYVNGKKVGRGEVLTEVAGAVKDHLTSSGGGTVSATVTAEPPAVDPLAPLTADEQATWKRLNSKVNGG